MRVQIFSSVSQTAVPGTNLVEGDTWLKGKKIKSSIVKHGENLHPNFSLSLKIHNTSVSAAFEKSHKKGTGVLLFNRISQSSTDPPHCCQRDHLERQVCYPSLSEPRRALPRLSGRSRSSVPWPTRLGLCVLYPPAQPTPSALASPPSTLPFARGDTGPLSDP